MPNMKKFPNILSKPSYATKTIFVGKESCSLQTNTNKPQKIKYNWEKLKEINKLLFIVTSSGQGLVLRSTVIRFLGFSSEKVKFLPELDLLVENVSLFMNK